METSSILQFTCGSSPCQGSAAALSFCLRASRTSWGHWISLTIQEVWDVAEHWCCQILPGSYFVNPATSGSILVVRFYFPHFLSVHGISKCLIPMREISLQIQRFQKQISKLTSDRKAEDRKELPLLNHHNWSFNHQRFLNLSTSFFTFLFGEFCITKEGNTAKSIGFHKENNNSSLM